MKAKKEKEQVNRMSEEEADGFIAETLELFEELIESQLNEYKPSKAIRKSLYTAIDNWIVNHPESR